MQALAFVSDAELSKIDRSEIIRCAAKQLAEQALHKLLADCVKPDHDYMEYSSPTLRLDVYVLPPDELHDMLAKAYHQGVKDSSWQHLVDNQFATAK